MPSFRKRELSPNSILDKDSLLDFFKKNNIKEIHAKKIWRLMLKNPKLKFDEITNLPKKAAAALSKEFVPLTSTVKTVSTSKDGKTTKLLIELQDGNMIETVVIRHSDTRSGGHLVVCVSSQIGCKMGCTFCATGTLGLIGNLKCAEILEQIAHAKLNVDKNIRNIVFMGMGEPLDNYNEVRAAINGMHDRSRFNLAWNHITLSTVGVVDKMKLFTNDFPKANLALSLHAPSQIVRKKIVPTSSAFTMKKLMNAILYHINETGNKIFIEYIMIGNVNASSENAHELGKLFVTNNICNKICVNLIPYNPTDIGDEHKFEAPNDIQLEDFKNIIIKSGIFCTIRRSTTSGRDVDGACGQLALKGNNIDIEDLIKKNKNKNNKKKRRKKKIKNKNVIKNNNKNNNNNNDDGPNIFKHINKQTILVASTVILAVMVTYGVWRKSNRKKK